MCPPALPPPSEIDTYWSDEQIIALLADYTPGSDLPDNVLTDLSPYQYPPSNLPEGIWFLVDSDEKKESAYGFWKAKGEACKVYSNSMTNGWRTTLEYFEGMAPHGETTDWLMQEYGITQKELSDKHHPEESRLLCRVFLCNEHDLKSETNPQNCKTIIESEDVNSVVAVKPNTDVTSEQESGGEFRAKEDHEVGAFLVVGDRETNSPAEDFWELECLSRGDFLELNDLEDPLSHSSSSQNSSCPSKSSDEYFDSSAFLRDIEAEENRCIQGGQPSTLRHEFGTSPNGFVLQRAVSGSVMSGCVSTNVIEDLHTTTDDESLTDNRTKENTTKRQNSESKTESTSNSSSSPKKAGPSRLKKLKTYFCFTSF